MNQPTLADVNKIFQYLRQKRFIGCKIDHELFCDLKRLLRTLCLRSHCLGSNSEMRFVCRKFAGKCFGIHAGEQGNRAGCVGAELSCGHSKGLSNPGGTPELRRSFRVGPCWGEGLRPATIARTDQSLFMGHPGNGT